MPLDKLFTPDQAAAYLQVRPKTLDRYVTRGLLPRVQISRKVYRFLESDLRRFVTDYKTYYFPQFARKEKGPRREANGPGQKT
jgi:excisionase family DNA binding protein